MSIYIPFLIFAFVASITPEPNNVMVFAIAAAHGTRAAVPAVVGVAIGFGLMVAIVEEGLAMPMARFPWLYGAMRWIGVAWTLVVAWTIARADTTAAAGQRSGSPPGSGVPATRSATWSPCRARSTASAPAQTAA